MDNKRYNLTPMELRAIQDHKYYLSQQRGKEVTIEEAIEDFLKRFAHDWRQEKFLRDNFDQRQEIDRHKWLRSEREGRDIGSAVAASEWCERFAQAWRTERESLERNGFRRRSMVVRTPHGLHMRPWSAVAQLAVRFGCELYVHKEGMPYWNFMLEGKPFVNVKSVLGLLSMGVALGDRVEFIAAGVHAREALLALAQLLTSTTESPP